MSVEPPVIAWQRGPVRIVAVHEEAMDAEFVHLVVEYRGRDAMGAESWENPAHFQDTTPEVVALLSTLAAEIVSTVEVLPVWVRDLVRSVREKVAGDDVLDVEENDGRRLPSDRRPHRCPPPRGRDRRARWDGGERLTLDPAVAYGRELGGLLMRRELGPLSDDEEALAAEKLNDLRQQMTAVEEISVSRLIARLR